MKSMFHELESYLLSKKGLFHAIFFCIWICVFFILFLFGDTFHRWWLLPLFIVVSFFAFSSKIQDLFTWKNGITKQILVLHVVWSAALIWWGVTALISQNIPLSIDAMKVQITLYLVFWIVYFRSSFLQTKQSSQVLSLVFILIGVVLCIVSIVFFLNPVLAAKLPSFNILYASYGHNHLASYLLLILPISWWWVYKSRSTVFLLIPVLCTFALLFSFGRVAVTIGLLQLFAVVYLFAKSGLFSQSNFTMQFTAIQKKIITLLLLVLFSLFISVLFFKFIFSVVYAVLPNSGCPIPQYRVQLCKPITSESRPEYWLQAIRAVAEYPLTGYGIGTFSLISNRYASQPWNITGYAHNAYLQFFAETGIIGGVLYLAVIGQLLYVLLNSSNHLNQTKKINKFFSVDLLFVYSVLLGFSSLLLNNFFDFDWSFAAVSLSAIILVVLGSSGTLPNAKVGKTMLSLISKIFAGLLVFIMATLFVLTAVTEWFYYQKKYEDIVRFFPYVSHYSVAFAEYAQWKDDELASLVSIHHRNPQFLSKILRKYQTNTAWYEWYALLQTAEPFNQFTQILVHEWLREYGTLEQKIDFYKSFFVSLDTFKSKNKTIELNSILHARSSIAKTYVETANEVYVTNNPQVAVGMYLKAQQVDQWILKETNLAFLDVNSPKPDIYFVHSIADQVGEKIGENQVLNFFSLYRKLLIEKMRKEDSLWKNSEITMEDVTKNHEFNLESFGHILEIAPWLSNEVWKEVSGFYVDRGAEELQMSEIELRQWYSFWEEFQRYGDSEDSRFILDSNLEKILAQKLQRTANLALSRQDYETAIEFIQKMQRIRVNEYAEMAQLGHLYVYLGDTDAAKKAYNDCALKYDQIDQVGGHFDCEVGLYYLEQGRLWKERYHQVSSVILEEADWSEF